MTSTKLPRAHMCRSLQLHRTMSRAMSRAFSVRQRSGGDTSLSANAAGDGAKLGAGSGLHLGLDALGACLGSAWRWLLVHVALRHLLLAAALLVIMYLQVCCSLTLSWLHLCHCPPSAAGADMHRYMCCMQAFVSSSSMHI